MIKIINLKPREEQFINSDVEHQLEEIQRVAGSDTLHDASKRLMQIMLLKSVWYWKQLQMRISELKLTIFEKDSRIEELEKEINELKNKQVMIGDYE